jgi:hypothetical protein
MIGRQPQARPLSLQIVQREFTSCGSHSRRYLDVLFLEGLLPLLQKPDGQKRQKYRRDQC